MMQVATYTCDQCGAETYQPVCFPSLFSYFCAQFNQCRAFRSQVRDLLQVSYNYTSDK